MPDYRDQVREVITPKFAATSTRRRVAEQLVAQAGIARDRRGLRHRRLVHRRRLGEGAGRRLVHRQLPQEKGEQRVDRAPAVPVRGRPGHDRRRVAGRRLHPVTGRRDRPGQPRAPTRALTHPAWYDLLDVPPDASTDEIRAAWRTAIAELEPATAGSALNRAAEVLLDPDRARGVRRRPLVRPAPTRPEPSRRAGPRVEARADRRRRRRRGATPDRRATAPSRPGSSAGWPCCGRVVSRRLAVVAAVRPGGRPRPPGPAQVAAERADRAGAVVRRRAPREPTRRAARRRYLTGGYREEYDQALRR